jgi:hypothetical protein
MDMTDSSLYLQIRKLRLSPFAYQLWMWSNLRKLYSCAKKSAEVIIADRLFQFSYPHGTHGPGLPSKMSEISLPGKSANGTISRSTPALSNVAI